MIDEIHVRNVALIEEATLVPAAGMTVLTGETGAGKTALLSACKLLMGERADKAMVREGTGLAQIEGRFYGIGAPGAAKGAGMAAEAEGAAAGSDGPEPDGDGADEVVVRRSLTADGRSRVAINGAMETVGALAALVGPTVDLCGQHEHQTLVRPACHGALLDGWAAEAVEAPLAAYEAAYRAAEGARAEHERVRELRQAGEAALEEARFTLRAIDGAGADPRDYDELVAYLAKTENAEALARAAHGACESLSGEGGALEAVGSAAAALTEGARFDQALAPYREDVEFDGAELADAQQKVAALQGLLRSYGPGIEEVLARREEAAELVASVDDADEREAAAARALAAAEAALGEAAEALHGARAGGARAGAGGGASMGRLEMGGASLECACELLPREEWGPRGPSRVEFLFRPGAGMQARPLGRIASGGEMSRVMLAIHVVLGEHDGVQTLVFDEVDAGVGGATAQALAQVLADLARSHQVLVVTHLAQVAVFADAHYVVRKEEGPVPQTRLGAVEGAARVDEVARMLSGTVTEASRAHAGELLAAAGNGA